VTFLSGWALLVNVVLWIALAIPAYIIGTRSNVSHSWVAAVPIVGATNVILRAARINGWWTLLCIPSVASFIGYGEPLLEIFTGLILTVWTALALPRAHDRSGWWKVALMIPGVNLVSTWAYALTLPSRMVGGTGTALKASE